MSDLAKRLPTTVVLLSIVYCSVRYLPTPYFSLLLYGMISLAGTEMIRLTRPEVRSLPLLFFNGALIGVSFVFPKLLSLADSIAVAVMIFGLFFLFSVRNQDRLQTWVRDFAVHILVLFYLYVPLYFLVLLHRKNPGYLFFLIAVISVGDTGAYFVGRAMGKHHIYKIASPKKTMEGLVAAVLTAALTGWAFLKILPLTSNIWLAVLSAALIGLFAQLSDPVESLFKRAAGQKDSGTLLPGHGGMLDRLDSYIFCAPLFALLIRYLWT